jgi:hypothetical protein
MSFQPWMVSGGSIDSCQRYICTSQDETVGLKKVTNACRGLQITSSRAYRRPRLIIFDKIEFHLEIMVKIKIIYSVLVTSR